MLDRRIARRLGRTGTTAVMVSEVTASGAAARAGMKPGDIVLEFDGHTIAGVDDLHRLLTEQRANKSVVISILRVPEINRLTIVPQSDG